MIRLAKATELDRILEIYESAKLYMRATGNPTQWAGNYPDSATLLDDISKSQLYVMESDLSDDGSAICGVFALIEGIDPTYGYIEGQWLNDEPYGVIHRIAVGESGKGTAAECFAFAEARCSNLRIDTHEKNIPMQRCLAKHGFARCGIIYLEDGDPRIAYQKVINNG